MLLAKAFYQRIFFKECARLKHKQLWWRCNYRNIPKCMQIEGREESQGQGLFFRLNGLTQYRYWIRNCLSMSGQDRTEIYVWIWRVDFGTLEGNYPNGRNLAADICGKEFRGSIWNIDWRSHTVQASLGQVSMPAKFKRSSVWTGAESETQIMT